MSYTPVNLVFFWIRLYYGTDLCYDLLPMQAVQGVVDVYIGAPSTEGGGEDDDVYD